jgi:YD repeat-containing protein
VERFGPADKTAAAKLQGWSKQINTVDPNTGQIKETACYDADGKPMQVGGEDGQFKTAFSYDPNGYVSEQITYDADLSESSHEKMKRDEHGNVVEKLFFEEGKQTGRVTREFDEQGNVTLAVYHDSNDRITEKEISRYKDGDRIIEHRLLTGDDQPLHELEGTPERRTGYSLERFEWDANGLETALVQEGFLEKPYTAQRQEFDGRGRISHLVNLDSKGNRVNNAQGWADVEFVYGSQSQWSGRRFFTADRQPVPEVVTIGEVQPDGPAERAGLKPGDVLRSYDGKPINSSFDYATFREQDAGEATDKELIVARDGKDLPPVKLKPGQLLGILTVDQFTAATSRP